MEPNDEPDLPPDLADLAVGDVLRDRQHDSYFEVTSIDDHGVGLYDGETDFYVPHALFATKYGARLHPIDEAESLDPPDWA